MKPDRYLVAVIKLGAEHQPVLASIKSLASEWIEVEAESSREAFQVGLDTQNSIAPQREFNPDNLLPKLRSGRRLTTEEMSAAFDRVKNSENWKLPIDKVIEVKDSEELEIIAEAIIFYAGSPSDAIPVHTKAKAGHKKYRIVAAGYYACVGS